jgi:Family of unknown function (DUF6680)
MLLGYDFDEVQLKRDCYRPIAHGNLEEDQHMLRKTLLEVMAGTRSLSENRRPGVGVQK